MTAVQTNAVRTRFHRQHVEVHVRMGTSEGGQVILHRPFTA